ncbi:hypothetical protein H1R20_g12243, partial [Candolleomyces eurysporus]
MSSNPVHPAEAGLPTLEKLGIRSKASVDSTDPLPIAQQWLESFAKSTSKQSTNIPHLVNELFLLSSFESTILLPDSEIDAKTGLPPVPRTGNSEPSVYWRDMLALTWDFRTFEGSYKIRKFLEDRLTQANIRNVKLSQETPPVLASPFPDLVWILLHFTFDTDVGGCTGVARLVPVAKTGETKWRAHTVYTRLESLHGVSESLGPGRKIEPYHGPWDQARAEEAAFKDREPTVIVVGAGQGGLGVAANLKVLGVDTLVLGNWLESYVDSLELNVWTSSEVTKVVRDKDHDLWLVTVTSKRQGLGGTPEEKTRTFRVKHVVFANGWAGGESYIPEIPGKDKFRGQVLHSFQHKKATDHSGKKVVVIGACTSAFDISVDYADHGVDVTMFQRSPTFIISATALRVSLAGLYSEDNPYPTEVADRLNMAGPLPFGAGLSYRTRPLLGKVDEKVIQGLEQKGFRVNTGFRGTGLTLQYLTRGGGYYIDVGGSQYIIDGRIKLKGSCGSIKEFTEKGLRFDDGSELDADVVVFCTGLGDGRSALARVLERDVIEKCPPLWGLTNEGEVRGCYKEIGSKNLWSMMGNLAYCRIHSKHVALQIKAIEKAFFHPSMWGFNVTDKDYPYDNRPVAPLRDYTFQQWWFHNHLDHPPNPGDFFELPAGKAATAEIACNKGATSFFASSEGGDIREPNNPNNVCPNSESIAYHTHGIDDLEGCALAIAYKDDVNQVQPEDFTIFSVNQTCVWTRFTDFSVPAAMPPCPAGGCICSFFWIHSPKAGGEENYMNGFRCNVTGSTSTVPLAKSQVARRCGSDPENGKLQDVPGNCTYGAKQPFYWLQAERNNVFEGEHSPPVYNDRYNFLDGAQNDIFEGFYDSIPDPAPNAPLPVGLGQVNATWQMAFSKALTPYFPNVQWIFPQASEKRVSMNQGMLRPSWFDIWQLPPHPEEYDERGITESVSAIEDLILSQIHLGVDPRRIFLMGFSQGAALALMVSLTTLNELGGVISLSGWLPNAYRRHITASPSIPILWCHGTDDKEIPLPYGRNAMQFIESLPGADASKTELKIYRGLQHTINDRELEDIAAFLHLQLQS